MAIDNIDYENWREVGDPAQAPSGWTVAEPGEHAGATPAPTPAPTPTPVEDDGPPTADDIYGTAEDFTTSQDTAKESIAAREAAAKVERRRQADVLFNPKIARGIETGKKQVGTAAGASGQRAGFNLSTAEATFIQGVQNEVDDRIKEIETAKASFISAGDFAAIERAETALTALEDKRQQMIINKANYALQAYGLGLEKEKMGLEERKFTQSQLDTAKQFDLAEDKFGLAMDEFDFRKEQFGEEKAMQWAQIMGFVQDGEGNMIPTLNAKQLEENIRHNRVTEGLQAAEQARLAQSTKTIAMENMSDAEKATVQNYAAMFNDGKITWDGIPAKYRDVATGYSEQLDVNSIIAAERADGASDEDIKDTLIAAGKREEFINSGFTQAGISIDTQDNLSNSLKSNDFAKSLMKGYENEPAFLRYGSVPIRYGIGGLSIAIDAMLGV